VIVADASALVAIGERESDAATFAAALENNETVISSINYVETGIVLISRGRLMSQADLDQWLERIGVSIVRGEALGTMAMAAYLRFGRGYHPAKLNLGDCFAYALAKSLGAPLLYKGNDFALTDIRSAL